MLKSLNACSKSGLLTQSKSGIFSSRHQRAQMTPRFELPEEIAESIMVACRSIDSALSLDRARSRHGRGCGSQAKQKLCAATWPIA